MTDTARSWDSRIAVETW